MPEDKKACLDRAKEWLSDPTPERLRYAALDARMVMELLTYDKLRAAADIIPPEQLGTWQAPQAVKVLLEFDDLADQSFVIDIGAHPPDSGVEQEWLRLGEHHALSLKWLRNYHKVGKLLHPPAANEAEPMAPEKQIALLQEVVAELEKALSSTITSMVLKGGCTFTCEACSKIVVGNRMAMDAGKPAFCPTPGCDAEYVIVPGSGDPPNLIHVVERFKCPSCEAAGAIARRKVKVGFEFACHACAQKFRVVANTWQFAPIAKT
jgi:hypothetical protein